MKPLHIRKHGQYVLAALITSMVAVYGILSFMASSAATAGVSIEPESGSALNPAAVVSDTGASGGKAVRFSTPSSPSGEAMPIGDLPGWKQAYTQDFTTNVALGNFPGVYKGSVGAYPDGWKDTSKNGTYYPTKVHSVSGGVLDWFIRTENGLHLVSAPTPEIPASARTYGRYAVRFRADPVPGYKTAWLLWPDSDNWSEGEIDFPEGGLNGRISGFSHCAGPNPQNNCLAVSTDKTYTSWHTAIIEWIPGRVTFILDGIQVGTTTNSVPSTPMHWVLQTETNLSSTPPPDSAAGHVQVDWIAAWARL
jgi:beta-glucanase (GH16 family)